MRLAKACQIFSASGLGGQRPPKATCGYYLGKIYTDLGEFELECRERANERAPLAGKTDCSERPNSISTAGTGAVLLANAFQPSPEVGAVVFQHGRSWRAVKEYVKTHHVVVRPISFKPVSFYGGLLLALAAMSARGQ